MFYFIFLNVIDIRIFQQFHDIKHFICKKIKLHCLCKNQL